MRVVVLGGAGFIGSAVCRHLVGERGATVLNLDKLTATSSLASLAPVALSPRYSFRKADICDREHVAALLQAFAPDAIVHAAAERRSGAGNEEAAAIETNVLGTWRALEAAREHWSGLPQHRQARFRFLSVSSLAPQCSPAGASRAAADALTTAWHNAYGLPTIVSRAADTFGPCQFPGEPVAAAVIAAIDGAPAPAGDGEPRAWLAVEDHARALVAMIERGAPGASYAVAGRGLISRAAMAMRIGRLVDRHRPRRSAPPRIETSAHLPAARSAEPAAAAALSEGAARLEQDTGWRAEDSIETALSRTVRWYLANPGWWRPLAAAEAAGNGFGLLRIA